MSSWPHFHSRLVHGRAFRCVAGRSRKYPDRPWFPDGRDLGQYGFLHLAAGSGRYRDASGRNQDVQAGAVFLLFPGLWHHYGPGPGAIWQEHFLDVDSPLLDALEAQGLLERSCPVLYPGPEARRPLLDLIDGIAAGHLRDPRECAWRLHGAVQALAEARDHAVPDPVRQARRELRNRSPDLPVDLRALAHSCGLSYESLRKRFKQTVGSSMQRYRLRIRCLRAADRVLAGDELEAVATATGFCDAAHLRRHFRSVFGCSPGAYRRLHGGH